MQRILVKKISICGFVRSYNKISYNAFYLAKSKSCRANNVSALSSSLINVQSRYFGSASSGNILNKIFVVDATSPETDIASPSSTVDVGLTSPSTFVTDKNALSNTVEYIPPPPVPPEFFEEPQPILNSLGEPTFASLGFDGWSPISIIQTGLEYIHVTSGLPWWGTIAIATFIIRIAVFPLVISTQRHSAIMSYYSPALKRLQDKMTEARTVGNDLQAAQIGLELQMFTKKHNLKPLKAALMPLIQAPIFISMFIGLRRCANLPVESFQTGGMLWFTDLTTSDPYFILPLITTATMLATIELGIDGQSLTQQTSPLIRYGIRALPVVVLPFVIYFPSAILCYWVSTNFFSLMQAGFLKIPAVRKFFKIPVMNIHSMEETGSKKGFIENVQESWSNMKVSTSVAERERMTDIEFQKAGTSPLIKTYKHNPLRVKAKTKD